MSDNVNNADPDHSELVDIRKKIRRNFFKKDVALKSYKCDFIGFNTSTPAKVYISNSALYVVHRPKRRKLTTISFNGIRELEPREANQCVLILMTDGTMYTLTNFQRPEPAVAFLINFWNLIRKEKLLLKSSCSTSNWSENSSSTERFALSGSFTADREGMHKVPTTISLTSSTSLSETDSVRSRRQPSTVIGSQKQIPRASPEAPSRTVTLYQPKCELRTRSTDRGTPMMPSSTIYPPSPTHANDTGLIPVQQPTRTTLLRAEAIVSLPHSKSTPQHLHSTANVGIPTMTARCPKTVVCLSETSAWSLWPLSFLPFPLSSPPQRLTMIIAYTILTFLLLSITHLYHRLAVFDLHRASSPLTLGSPELHTTTTTDELRESLNSLEVHLSQLVKLASQLAQSLIQMTAEIRGMQHTTDAPNLDSVPT